MERIRHRKKNDTVRAGGGARGCDRGGGQIAVRGGLSIDKIGPNGPWAGSNQT